MANYFDCAALMGQLTSAEMQRKLKQASGAEAYNKFLLLVNGAPVADVAPVVHCKDCRYWGDADGISTNVDGVRFARCRAHNHYVAGMHIGWCYAEDDFCSYGAREDGDSDGE